MVGGLLRNSTWRDNVGICRDFSKLTPIKHASNAPTSGDGKATKQDPGANSTHVTNTKEHKSASDVQKPNTSNKTRKSFEGTVFRFGGVAPKVVEKVSTPTEKIEPAATEEPPQRKLEALSAELVTFINGYLIPSQKKNPQDVVGKFISNPKTQEYLGHITQQNDFMRTLEIASNCLKVGFWEFRGLGRLHAKATEEILNKLYKRIAMSGFLDQIERNIDILAQRGVLDTYYLKIVNQFITVFLNHLMLDSPIPSRLQKEEDFLTFGKTIHNLFVLYFEFSPYLKDTWDENFLLKMMKAHELADNLLRSKITRDDPTVRELSALGLRFWKLYELPQLKEFLKNRNDTNFVYLLYIYSKYAVDKSTLGVTFIEEYLKRRSIITPSIFSQIMYSFGKMGLFNAAMITDSKTMLRKPDIDPMQFCQFFIFLLSNNSLTQQDIATHTKTLSDILKTTQDLKLATNCVKAAFLMFAAGHYSRPYLEELVKCAVRLDLTSNPTFLKIIHTCMVDEYPEKSSINAVINNHLNSEKMRLLYYDSSNMNEQNSLYSSGVGVTDRPTAHTPAPPGYLVRQLERYLTKGGFRVYREYDLGYHNVDLFVPDLKLFIEVDGEVHTRMQENISGLTEHTVFRNKLISKFSPFGDGYSLLVVKTGFEEDMHNTAIKEVMKHINKNKPTL